MLEVSGLQAGYGLSQVLFDMHLTIEQGQVVSLIGRNGMGKTTTVKSIMGLLKPSAGSIRIHGQEMRGATPYRIAQAGLGLVPEGRRTFGSLSVKENLLATATKGGKWDLARIYALFPRLEERQEQLSKTLSGGEQQMLVVGRALMTNPQLLILDEATEGLAPVIRETIWNCLVTLKAEGETILVIDKNLKEMARVVDRHHIIEKGRQVWQGTPDQLAATPELSHRYLGV
ncbi:ABC transporter ATP-binding protein [Pseudomonas sp. JS3066]|jgi:branched-chain amino acid transport system ATP-binding protein|uniref:ABC transporter ATP-binding protein n=1 Tax=unclassified Pseudomonas TaxID=196821 RepID=UPI000EAA0D33|nr:MULTISPECIES: ABC transporter ATP-binding protein [unclassified Pseudomonas]AYF90687.1 ABC transporter ATP-binding protein [Pseudomonas sp. DY-1]MDH4652697.1 ABC transporter ATP-binding protein [Pseudomonas sp. BN606]MRK20466.1 ABC transporter ATP-binding protein [Pseudomonas sp. JG-B]WVK91743.1 ABC transporter ATP-binding protein [Pseudomonas sp. JS3066]